MSGRGAPCKPRPSLRLIVAAVSCTLILVVASIAIVVNHTIARDFVKSLGRDYVSAVLRAAQYRSERSLIAAAQKSLVLAHVTRQSGYRLPREESDAQAVDGAWTSKYFDPMLNVAMVNEFGEINSTFGYLFDDGSSCVGVFIPGTDVLHMSCANGVFLPNRVRSDRNIQFHGYDRLPTGAVPSPFNATGDGRIGSYQLLRPTFVAAKLPLAAPFQATDFGEVRFVLPFGYPLFNASGFAANPMGAAFIGVAFVSLQLDFLNAALRESQISSGMHVIGFEVTTGLLFASTWSTPIFTRQELSAAQVAALPVNPACSSTSTTRSEVNTPDNVSYICRRTLSQYSTAYAPLANLPSDVRNPRDSTTSRLSVYQVKADGESYFIESVLLTNPTGDMLGWDKALLVVVPQNTFTDDLRRADLINILVCLGAVIVAAVVSLLISNTVLAPLRGIAFSMRSTALLDDEAMRTTAAGRLWHGDASDSDDSAEEAADMSKEASAAVKPDAAGASSGPSKTSVDDLSIIAEIRALQKVQRALDAAVYSFARYVPTQVVRSLMGVGQLAQLGMQETTASILFSDIVGFTTVCETLAPADLSNLLRAYFTMCTEQVDTHQGVVDKFVGDAIMAMWGAPAAVRMHELKATLCAMNIHRLAFTGAASRVWRRVKQPLGIRMGVHTGPVLVGNIGCDTRLSYTAMGDTVNCASRLEGLNKQFGTRVLISEATNAGLAGTIATLALAKVSVVGKVAAMQVYEPIAVMPDAPTAMQQMHMDAAEGSMNAGAAQESSSAEPSSAAAAPDSPTRKPGNSGGLSSSRRKSLAVSLGEFARPGKASPGASSGAAPKNSFEATREQDINLEGLPTSATTLLVDFANKRRPGAPRQKSSSDFQSGHQFTGIFASESAGGVLAEDESTVVPVDTSQFALPSSNPLVPGAVPRGGRPPGSHSGLQDSLADQQPSMAISSGPGGTMRCTAAEVKLVEAHNDALAVFLGGDEAKAANLAAALRADIDAVSSAGDTAGGEMSSMGGSSINGSRLGDSCHASPMGETPRQSTPQAVDIGRGLFGTASSSRPGTSHGGGGLDGAATGGDAAGWRPDTVEPSPAVTLDGAFDPLSVDDIAAPPTTVINAGSGTTPPTRSPSLAGRLPPPLRRTPSKPGRSPAPASVGLLTPNAGALVRAIGSYTPGSSILDGSRIATTTTGAPRYDTPLQAVDRAAELLLSMCDAVELGFELVGADRVFRPTDK